MDLHDQPPQGLQAAFDLIRAGRYAEAKRCLAPVAGGARTHPAADYLLGLALQSLGDVAGATRAMRLAIGKDRGQAAYHGALGDILERSGDAPGAQAAYDAALTLDPSAAPAALGLARVLLRSGDAGGSQAVLRDWAGRPDASKEILLVFGAACQACADLDAALAPYERVLAVQPADPEAAVGRAAALVELERFSEAEATVREVLRSRRGDAQAWLTLARALRGRGAWDEAAAAYRSAAAQQESSSVALREHAELVWMTTGDLDQALAVLDGLGGLELSLARAELVEGAGDLPQAFALLRPIADGLASAEVQMAAARLASRLGDREGARARSAAAAALAARSRPEMFARCEALLAAGRPGEAAEVATELARGRPTDQRARALLGVAWRIMDDPRYDQVFHYPRLVRSRTLATPQGWPSLQAYIADLAIALGRLHDLKAPPIGQSVRGGTQTHASLKHSDDPAIRGFFQAIDAPIRSYLRDVSGSPAQAYRLGGIWSVRLAAAGRHTDHIHPAGWLSTACYVALPQGMAGDARGGWLKFGEPGVVTDPSLPPDHFVEPKAGELVIFPSYMWHGTVPFEGPGERLTVAFDILPG